MDKIKFHNYLFTMDAASPLIRLFLADIISREKTVRKWVGQHKMGQTNVLERASKLL